MEYYGEKPKRFSDKWWENFFYYHKKHVIIGIAVVVVFGYIIYSDMTSTKYDLSIDYISEIGITTDDSEKIAELAESVIDDATGNEVCDAFVLALNMGETQDIQYAQAMQVKYMTEQAYSEAYVFIMSKQYADQMTGVGVLEPVSVWSGQDSDAETLSLAGCTALEGTNINPDELYLAVRKVREEEEDDERKLAEYENGKKFARYLIDKR